MKDLKTRILSADYKKRFRQLIAAGICIFAIGGGTSAVLLHTVDANAFSRGVNMQQGMPGAQGQDGTQGQPGGDANSGNGNFSGQVPGNGGFGGQGQDGSNGQNPGGSNGQNPGNDNSGNQLPDQRPGRFDMNGNQNAPDADSDSQLPDDKKDSQSSEKQQNSQSSDNKQENQKSADNQTDTSKKQGDNAAAGSFWTDNNAQSATPMNAVKVETPANYMPGIQVGGMDEQEMTGGVQNMRGQQGATGGQDMRGQQGMNGDHCMNGGRMDGGRMHHAGFVSRVLNNSNVSIASKIAVLATTILGIIWAILMWLTIVFYVFRTSVFSGMNKVLWTVLAAVGHVFALIAFLIVRSIVNERCERCETWQDAGSEYCSNCGNAMSTNCPNCNASVSFHDAWCASCGTRLKLKDESEAENVDEKAVPAGDGAEL